MTGLEAAIEPCVSRLGNQYQRPIRKDRQVLLCVVVSYPTPITKMTDDDWATAAAVKDSSIEYLQRWLGDNLKTVIAHVDEGHYHLHAYAYDSAFRSELHPGYAAIKALGKNPGKAGTEAYNVAAKAKQAEFYDQVGAPLGFPRYSENRRGRVDRKTAKMISNLQSNIEQLRALEAENTALIAAAAAELAQSAVAKADADRKSQIAIQAANVAAAEKTRLATELAMTTEDRNNILTGGDDLIAQLKTEKAKAAAADRAREAAEERALTLEQDLNKERIHRQSAEAQRGSQSVATGREHDAAVRIHGQLTQTQEELTTLQRDHIKLLEAHESDQVTIAELRAIIERLTGGSGGSAVVPKSPAPPKNINVGPSTPLRPVGVNDGGNIASTALRSDQRPAQTQPNRQSPTGAPPKPQRIGVAGAIDVAKASQAQHQPGQQQPGQLKTAAGVEDLVVGAKTSIRPPDRPPEQR